MIASPTRSLVAHGSTRCRFARACVQIALGHALFCAGRLPEAEKAYIEAIGLHATVIREFFSLVCGVCNMRA